ncbi:cytochrome c [Rhizobium sp. BK529]|uniref:c-type cytochrome n=1 Tax=unclassified Rhizobium TaxID=2613769 RepID=UPI00104E1F00|nr:MULTISPECIES: cytochrome c family protein [unclassified Rhizobium]MBB3595790.1 cytochrome c [Rhizobium sp. BK529]TCR98342.1 cytochrome c [Rhizobium sp. BK418]
MWRTIARAILAASIAGSSFAADADRGARIFRSCASCHIVNDTRSTFGPSLKGVVGRRAAIVGDYAYSPALKKAGEDGLIWNERELAEFLASPSRKIPGTKMRFWGLWNFEIDDLIAFLKANP